MKHWKLIILAMTVITGSLSSQNAGNHNPEFSVPDTFMSGEPYIFIGEDDTEVFDPRTPITLQLRNPPEDGEPYNGSTTLQWSNSPSNVLAFDESNAMTGFKEVDQQGEGETSGSWSWSNDNQSNFDGDIIFFQGSASAQSGSTVTLESYHSDDVNDKFTKDFTLLKVDLTSDKAVNSPKTFYSDASSLVTPPSPGSMASGDLDDLLSETLVIDYDQVLNAEGEVEDFYVEMSIPSSIGASVNWALTETPGGSAQITNASSTTARLEFDSASRGGLYKIELTIGGAVTLEGRVWLPVAGPDIESAFSGWLTNWTNWGNDYRADVPSRYPMARDELINRFGIPALVIDLGNLDELYAPIMDMEYLGSFLDYVGAPAGNKTPSGYPEQSLPGEGYTEPRYTLSGAVLDFPARNNILYAYVGRQMEIGESILILGPNIHPDLTANQINTADGPVQVSAYNAGFELFNGTSVSDVMDSRGRSILNVGVDHLPAYKEWPSYEITSDGFDLIQEGESRRDILINGPYDRNF